MECMGFVEGEQLRFGIWKSGVRFRVSGFGFRVSRFGFRFSDFGFRVADFGFGAQNFKCRRSV
jgi:hypothetical protein